MHKKFIIACISVVIINVIVIVIALLIINQNVQDVKSELVELIKSEVKKEYKEIEMAKTNKAKEALYPMYREVGLNYNKNPQTVVDTWLPFLKLYSTFDSAQDEKNEKSK